MSDKDDRNALTDIKWLAFGGGMTPREVLVNAHALPALPACEIGYEAGAALRVLMPLTALVVRRLPGRNVCPDKPLPVDAVDAALATVAAGAMLCDPVQPFLQRPAVPGMTASADQESLRKLNPSVPAVAAADFWHLASQVPDSMNAEEVCMALAVYHHYSMTGNNRYADDKSVNGAPGIRYLGEGRSATEVLWAEPTLLGTLMASLPGDWVEGEGLPAWADRKCLYSQKDGSEHPLWRATWSSNAAVLRWKDERVVGSCVGGVPADWYPPRVAAGTDAAKKWWDQRNAEDPLYLYRSSRTGELKAHRLDLGLDGTRLAVHWNAIGAPASLFAKGGSRVAYPQDPRLAFLRHRVEGTGSSPMIRASEIFVPASNEWAPSLEVADDLSDYCQAIEKLDEITKRPFLRRKDGPPALLDPLSPLVPDLVTSFWRQMTPVFMEMVTELHEGGALTKTTWEHAGRAALSAFDETVEPHYSKWAPRIEIARAQVDRTLRQAIAQTWKGEAFGG